MRKILTLLVALALVLASLSALAETTCAFEDFTLTLPDGMSVEQDAKAENAIYFTATMDGTSNLNCVWNSEFEDITAIDVDATADELIEAIVAGVAEAGITVDNPRVGEHERIQLGGKDALVLNFSFDYLIELDGEEYRISASQRQVFVSEEGLGTYVFTMTGAEAGDLQSLQGVLETIDWND